MIHNCPLCNNPGNDFYRSKKKVYYQCGTCKGLYVDQDFLPDRNAEKIRYHEHNNDVEDEGYQKFVLPITSLVQKNHAPSDEGLDFGAGTGPVIPKVLGDKNYNIRLYDPFFHDDPSMLTRTYDYIVCCEVIEHFHQPKKEFQLLKKLLKPQGKLYCYTDIYLPGIDFHLWYYKNDLTHVFIYQTETLHWIRRNIGFSSVSIEDRLIVYTN